MIHPKKDCIFLQRVVFQTFVVAHPFQQHSKVVCNLFNRHIFNFSKSHTIIFSVISKDKIYIFFNLYSRFLINWHNELITALLHKLTLVAVNPSLINSGVHKLCQFYITKTIKTGIKFIFSPLFFTMNSKIF